LLLLLLLLLLMMMMGEEIVERTLVMKRGNHRRLHKPQAQEESLVPIASNVENSDADKAETSFLDVDRSSR